MKWRLLLLLCGLLVGLRPAWSDPEPSRLLLLRGAIALTEGSSEQAVSDLDRAADLLPDDWTAQMLDARALVKSGDLLLARSQMRRAALLAPTCHDCWTSGLQLAQEMKDLYLQVFFLSGLQRFFPRDPRVQQQLMQALRAVNKPVPALRAEVSWRDTIPQVQLDPRDSALARTVSVEDLRERAKAEKPDAGVLTALASLAWWNKHTDEARDLLKRAYALAPRDRGITSNYVALCLLAGKTDEAVTVLKAAAPLGEYALDRALALWSLDEGHYADAQEALLRLHARDPVDYTVNLHLGMTYLLTDNPSAALPVLRIAWLTNRSELAAQHYAAALHAAGQSDEAVTVLKTAIAQLPKDSLLRLQLAALYRDTGHLDESAQIMAEMSKVRSEALELQFMAGEQFVRAGYVGRGNIMAAALRDTTPTDLLALRNAARLYRLLNAPEDAHLMFSRFSGPNARPTDDRIGVLLELARNAIDANQLAEAVVVLRDLLNTGQGAQQAYAMLGRVYLHQERWSEAMRIYAQARMRWDDDVDFMLGLAHAARNAGDRTTAVSQYRRAALMRPGADVLLDFADLYHAMGNEPLARSCWHTAQDYPGGVLRGRLRLLRSYLAAGDPPPDGQTLDDLQKAIPAERDRCRTRWRTSLHTLHLTVTDEELDALLQLAPDMLDASKLDTLVK